MLRDTAGDIRFLVLLFTINMFLDTTYELDMLSSVVEPSLFSSALAPDFFSAPAPGKKYWRPLHPENLDSDLLRLRKTACKN